MRAYSHTYSIYVSVYEHVNIYVWVNLYMYVNVYNVHKCVK